MTDTPERELIEQLRAFAYQLSRCSEITLGKQDCAETSTELTQAADTIEALLSRVDKLEETLRIAARYIPNVREGEEYWEEKQRDRELVLNTLNRSAS